MLKYQVRSRDLIDVYNDIKSGRIIISPYFQRNLVWRELHKKEFVDTILKGYPFPQIFIARGEINVETMTSESCIVDGQQRVNAICEFIENRIEVNGSLFKDIGQNEKQSFLKYQIPVIDLDILATDPIIIEIFKRLNRTFYSLSTIEKMATEYGTVDFMLIAKHLCDLITREDDTDENQEQDSPLRRDPNLPEHFLPWAEDRKVDNFRKFILERDIFSAYETSRMVHLMYCLNLMSTLMYGFFNRNDKTKDLLENNEDMRKSRDRISLTMERSAEIFLKLDLPKSSIFWGKANSFSLFIIIAWLGLAEEDIEATQFRKRLVAFEQVIPTEYLLSAREAVNNRKQRIERHNILSKALGIPEDENPLFEKLLF